MEETPHYIGRYQIEKKLGEGGMAVVYLARDPQFGRLVAVKTLLLPPHYSELGKELRARFEREAKIIAALEHPYIVPVYDFGEHEGQPFIVMRYMTGGSLYERLQHGKLSLPDTAALIQKVASALDMAHKHGIVHRDLKPGNILFDANNEPYVSDFGIAKLKEAATHLTSTGAVVGTPAYMSPEQVQGEKDIDGRSDVYSLGALVFEALTGATPYNADTPGKMMMKHVLEPVPRVLESNPALPPGCDAVIEQAMAKNRDERYVSALALAQDLSRMAEGREPDAAPPTRLRPKPGPRPIVWLGLIGLGGTAVFGAAVVVAGLLIAPFIWRSPTPTDTLAPTSVALATSIPQPASETPTPSPTPLPSLTPTPSHTATPVPPTSGPAPTLGVGATLVSQQDGMTLMYVPLGKFRMGSNRADSSDDQKPEHEVLLTGFWIDQTEVTNWMYSLCVSAKVCQPPYRSSSDMRESYFGNPEFDNYPVVYVSWDQARDYCEWAGRRLPTEAEWEKAARGADGRLYPWGNSAAAANRLNFADSSTAFDYRDETVNDGYADTSPVGVYLDGASPYGVLDMAGNVWEWVADWYAADYYLVSPDHNPQGPGAGERRVLRGGSWNNGIISMRVINRAHSGPGGASNFSGFRCAMTP